MHLFKATAKILIRQVCITLVSQDYTFGFPGELYSHDDQCKMIYGNESVACPRNMRGRDYKYCEQLKCLNKLVFFLTTILKY